MNLENRILRHISTYKLTIPFILKRTICSGKEQAETELPSLLSKLCTSQKVEEHEFPASDLLAGKSAPREKYYTVPGTKPKVDYDLGTLIFCFCGSRRRYRLTNQETENLFENLAPHHHIRHCLSEGEGGPYVLRIYPTSSTVKGTLQYLKKKHLADSNKLLPSWVNDGDYGIALLVESESKKEALEAQIARTAKSQTGGKGRSLLHQARIVVEVAPTSQTISSWLSENAK